MAKVKHLDFILEENNLWKTIFRFYPRSSRCHSFDEHPPKSWNGVYKVYYRYKIIKMWKDDNEHMILFDSGVDECSVIDEVAARIKLIVKGIIVHHGETSNHEAYSLRLLNNDIIPCGDGVTWNISKVPRTKSYRISLFDYEDVGYRFILQKDKLAEFGKYLDQCCEYMLAHGDPI